MTALDELINYWQTILDFQPHLLTEKILYHIGETIKALKELKKLKGE